MKKLFRNRLFIAFLCVVLAMATIFLGVPKLLNIQNETVGVCIAATDLPAGTLIEKTDIQLRSLLRTEVGPRDCIDPELLIGKYAAVQLYAGDILNPERFVDEPAATLAEDALMQGKRFMSVTLSSLAAGVSGFIKPGDWVAVVCTEADDSAAVSTIRAYVPSGLDKVQVLAVENSKNEQTLSVRETNPTKEAPENNLPSTVTLIVDGTQMLALAAAEKSGSLHLAYVGAE